MIWNAQSINSFNKKTELELFLHSKNIDILLLNETFLTSDRSFKLNGYNIHREDRNTPHGGVAIAVKKNIKHNLLPRYPTVSIENISIIISIGGIPTILTSAYCPKYSTMFKEDLKKITPNNKAFIIGGDFNAHHTSWNCIRSNTAGNILYNYQLRSQFYIHHSNSPTRYPQDARSKPSTIDIALSNITQPISTLLTHDNELESDHSPVTFSLDTIPTEINKIQRIDFKRANWFIYRRKVESLIEASEMNNEYHNEEGIDAAVQRLIDVINTAKDGLPRKTENHHLFKISDSTQLCIKERNKYKRLFQRCNDPVRKQLYRSITKQLSNLAKENVLLDRNKNWNNFLSNLPTGSNKFWAITKAFKGKKTQTIPYLTYNNKEHYADEEKVELIANNFEKSHTLTQQMSHSNDKKVNNFVKTLGEDYQVNNDENTYATTDEIKCIIKAMKNNKAPGFDGIQNILLKNLPENAISLLTKIINSCLRISYFPREFKKAKVICIPKPGKDPRLPSSYRPISLLSSIDKIIEKTILARINRYAEDNEVINKEQFGFRAQHSTIHQVKRITNIVKANKRCRQSTGMILMDIEKAFDSIWHNGLIFKLNKFGFPLYLNKLISSFLADRTFQVTLNGSLSTTKKVPAGVPQGAVLSPTLYSIYIADYKNQANCDIAFYADDSAIITKAKSSDVLVRRLQKGLKFCDKFYFKWKIQVNIAKTQAILFPFNKSAKRITRNQIQNGNTQIPFSNTVKYLGIHLDRKLNFSQHINSTADRAVKCSRALYPLLCKRSFLSEKNKVIIYRTIIRTLMLYGCYIWHIAANTHKNKLQVIQNKNLKTIHNLPMRFSTLELHERFQHPTISNVINNQNLTWSNKCSISSYELIRELAE
jgi:hypothetical protein